MIKIITNNPSLDSGVESLAKMSGDQRTFQVIEKCTLFKDVEAISIPRHYKEEPENNKKVFQWILDRLLGYGYQVRIIGEDRNIIAYSGTLHPNIGTYTLVGAHYDSVPETPGADDNASAVIAMLETAYAFRPGERGGSGNLIFAAFNQEEDGLLGSALVAEQLYKEGIALHEVHILEMVGFTSEKQTTPPDLPVTFRDKGDFIALLSNDKSNDSCEKIVKIAENCGLPAVGIQTMVSTDQLPDVLHRSDHSSFWKIGVPAILWTDTAEYRSPHYHQTSDTPDTLDYEFMHRVIQTLVGYLEGAEK